jgi:hypothetical protein
MAGAPLGRRDWADQQPEAVAPPVVLGAELAPGDAAVDVPP